MFDLFCHLTNCCRCKTLLFKRNSVNNWLLIDSITSISQGHDTVATSLFTRRDNNGLTENKTGCITFSKTPFYDTDSGGVTDFCVLWNHCPHVI